MAHAAGQRALDTSATGGHDRTPPAGLCGSVVLLMHTCACVQHFEMPALSAANAWLPSFYPTRPFTAQALIANRISPSGPVGSCRRSSSFKRSRAASSSDVQYFGADPVPPRNGAQ
jgi:hypothetical protein